MELHVKRDEKGTFIDAEILNFSTEDWVVIHWSLKESLLAGQESLEYFQNSLEHRIEDDQYDLRGIEAIKKTIQVLENDINMLEKLIKAFNEPITTRML